MVKREGEVDMKRRVSIEKKGEGYGTGRRRGKEGKEKRKGREGERGEKKGKEGQEREGQGRRRG